MKEHNQTPQKEDITNRRSNDSRLKKPTKKSLNGAFSPVSEDVSSDSTKESAAFSSLSETSDANSSSRVAKCQSSELVSATSESFTFIDATPISKTASKDDNSILSMEHSLLHKLELEGSVEVDIVANFLKQARNQVLNSNDVNQQSKKLLDALVKVVLDEFYPMPEEKDCCSELVSLKFRIVFLSFFFWCFLVSVILFGLRLDTYGGLSPT